MSATGENVVVAPKLKMFVLNNPSDSYTFYAPSIDVAGAAVALLSTSYGATCVEADCDESTPILFGWDSWLKERGINSDWCLEHALELAAAFDSFVIGGRADRVSFDDAISRMTSEDAAAFAAKWHDDRRSSMNDIGKAAKGYAERMRQVAAKVAASKS